MNKAQKTLLEIVQNFISNKNNSIDGNILNDIEYLSDIHACTTFVYKGLAKMNLTIPDSIEKKTIASIVMNYKNLSVQDEVIRILHKNGIKCAILKGSSVATYYPDPIYRILGDIDVLVDVQNYYRAIKLLTGDNDCDMKKENHKFHYGFIRHGISIEIHKYVTEYPNDKFGDALESYMSNALDDVDYESYEGFKFPVLDIERQSVALLLHTKRHFVNNKLTLRMLCDWSVFIRMVCDVGKFEAVLHRLSLLGLDKFFNLINEVRKQYLSINCKEVKSIYKKDVLEFFIMEFVDGGLYESEKRISQNIGNIVTQYKIKYKRSSIAVFKTINYLIMRRLSNDEKKSLCFLFYWLKTLVVLIIESTREKKLKINIFRRTQNRREEIYRILEL